MVGIRYIYYGIYRLFQNEINKADRTKKLMVLITIKLVLVIDIEIGFAKLSLDKFEIIIAANIRDIVYILLTKKDKYPIYQMSNAKTKT